jgi:hypothetical protein
MRESGRPGTQEEQLRHWQQGPGGWCGHGQGHRGQVVGQWAEGPDTRAMGECTASCRRGRGWWWVFVTAGMGGGVYARGRRGGGLYIGERERRVVTYKPSHFIAMDADAGRPRRIGTRNKERNEMLQLFGRRFRCILCG